MNKRNLHVSFFNFVPLQPELAIYRSICKRTGKKKLKNLAPDAMLAFKKEYLVLDARWFWAPKQNLLMRWFCSFHETGFDFAILK